MKLTQKEGCSSKKTQSGCVSVSTNTRVDLDEKIMNHPCYSEEAHHYFARMHVAVAPACNIQCNYCNRMYDCANESRPGVVSEVLKPEEAIKKSLVVAGEIPQLSVIGIAGPGDPLANPEKTLATFKGIREQASDLRLCLSTNGLKLMDYIDEIQALDIEHVTVTINAVDPEIGKDIYSWIYYNGKRYKGLEAAEILIKQQLAGLEALTERGILCKVNSVLIPGVNDLHLKEVSKVVKEKGAFLHNIMPIIVAEDTEFARRGIREPLAEELNELRSSCSGDMKMMKHCRQCRADAVGLLGEDRSEEFTKKHLETMTSRYDPIKRSEHQEELLQKIFNNRVKRKRREVKGASFGAQNKSQVIRFAVTSRGDGDVNLFLGQAKEFMIYEVENQQVKFIGIRKLLSHCKGKSSCSQEGADTMPEVVNTIKDCQMLVCAGIGEGANKFLNEHGIIPIVQEGEIEEVLLQTSMFYRYFYHGSTYATASVN
ncbi:nitrogenase cofactor biosynthesis protein NifB [Anaerobacillus alkalidiazotrophicus]|uniref:Nitrogenase cofactor biosynthesis protein NifB n=1 Tax=Anaerobacillus alkalidiazotrophicus TaxID=472963 RepID=A0A1S2M957_9BACI|nr:nitrogenase cofactor biosynthesis protein NifB [Anaerobacillus alkalidiazotrophicus]OIJ21258.1 nitrogenase cofactor biosynthesis protein NifB [Anaerobacillus alkalidiazotrophicus]